MKRIVRTLLFIIGVIAYALEEPSTGTAGKRSDAADTPAELPKQGWKTAFKETKKALKDKDISTAAAGLAYYGTITFFPALVGVATCFTYFADPATLLRVIDSLKAVVPGPIADLLRTQLAPLAATNKGTLGWAAIISIGLLLWTTSGGVQNLIKAMNKAYDIRESRNLVKLRLASIVLSGGLLVFVAATLGLLVLKGNVLEAWGWPRLLAVLFPWLRWVLLAALISAGLAFIYRYAPDRPDPRWQWVSWGAVAAAVIWMAGSAAFFIYAQNFADFGKTYGTFAGIIILMTWFNLSSLIIVLGAQVNHNLELQTSADKVTDD